MIIAVDLGNSALTIGVYEGATLHHRFFTNSDLKRTSLEYRLIIKSFFEAAGLDLAAMTEIVFAGVVPPLAPIVKEALAGLFPVPILTLGKKTKTGLAIHVDHPSEVGADLVAASVGGVQRYGAPLVIADLGTASKIIAIDATGAFIGVSIAPGLAISAQALVGRAAQLAEVNLEMPQHVIGRNTADSVNSGILYGHAAMIKGLVQQVSAESGCTKQAILTGGYSKLVKGLLPDMIYDENLLLDGLIVIRDRN